MTDKQWWTIMLGAGIFLLLNILTQLAIYGGYSVYTWLAR